MTIELKPRIQFIFSSKEASLEIYIDFIRKILCRNAMVLEVTDGRFHIMIDQSFADDLYVAGLDCIQHPTMNLLLIVYNVFVLTGTAVKDDGVAAVHAAPQGI